MLEFRTKKKKNSVFSQVMDSVYGFCHSALQSFKYVCVKRGPTCIKLTFHLHHGWHSCSVFTALWCGCSVIKFTFYISSPDPILALSSVD